jgi:4-carboxymuconolactone decarboxylase
MTVQSQNLGGRLPLLEPEHLSASQKKAYELIDTHVVPQAETANFRSKTDDGRLIGPFNPALYSPEISIAFLAWQATEEKHTSLDARTRQVVILAVGAVWKTDYELYAHAAVARKAGLSERAISQLSAGELADDLNDAERIAQKYATQLTASRRIDDDLFALAKEMFGAKGVMDITSLIGAYQVVCGTLNGFAIPSPDPSASVPPKARTTRKI